MLKRIVSDKIKEKLNYTGCIVLSGAKDMGKTTICTTLSNTKYYLDDLESNILENVKKDPSIIKKGKNPILIDEWWLYPPLWNIVRNDIDKQNKYGLYILTGSGSDIDENIKKTLHSGSGRFSTIILSPLSFSEKKKSLENIEFNELFNWLDISLTNKISRSFYIDEICRGGRPRLINTNIEYCIDSNIDYIQQLVNYKLRRNGIARNTLIKVINSLSRNVCTQVKNETIAADVGISVEYIPKYLNFLIDMNLLIEINAWNAHINSSAKLRTKPKYILVDPAFAIASLSLNPEKISKNSEVFGFLFENLVLMDLITYCNAKNHTVSFYRDSEGLEIDCIIENKNGEWIGIEIKLGAQEGIDTSIENFKKLLNKLELKARKNNKGLYIITAENKTYKKDIAQIISFAELYYKF